MSPGKSHRVSIRQKPRPAPFSGKALRALVMRALDVLGSTGSDVRILVVDDPEMARMNERFMGHEGTTTVISFPEDEPTEGETARVAGDILLSAPTCLAQTAGWDGSPEQRIFFFILHGMLHLLGYDHVGERSQARRMRAREMRVYRAVLGEPIG